MARDKASAVESGADRPDPGAWAAEGDHRTLGRLAEELLPTLIARLGASGLGELEVRQDGWRVRLRRSANGVANLAPAPGSKSSSTKGGGRAPAGERRPDKPGGGESAAESAGRRERGRVAVTSPAVGYYQPRDGLAAGATVRGGDSIGHVDVLGVRHDVVVPEDGNIATLTAQPGEAVEYGQLLARLEPQVRG